MLRNEMFKKFDKYNFLGNEKVVLITHNDLDGSGPVLVLKKVFKNLTVVHVTNGDMESVIHEFVQKMIKSEIDVDYLFICDIRCSIETANLIVDAKISDKVILLDHHPTAANLNNYPFALIALDENPTDSFSHSFYKPFNVLGHPSGSSLMLDFVYYKNLLKNDDFLNELIFNIECFDTWDWFHQCNKLQSPMRLNQLFVTIGMKLFDNHYDSDRTEIFDDFDKKLLEIEDFKIEEYCNDALNRTKVITISEGTQDYSCVFVFAAEYFTALFEKLESVYKNVDFYVIDTGISYSLRCRKPDIHIGKFAEKYGGGGHAEAAGISYSNNIRINQFKNMLLTPKC